MESSRFLIAGEWRSSARTLPIRNPYSGETAGEVFQAGSADINDAIVSACEAFQQTKGLPAFERASALQDIAVGIRARKDEFARLITSDTGKPISLARIEVDRSIFTFTTASEEAKRIGGEVIPLDLAPHAKSRFGFTRRFPLGPIAAITPFNFPINLVAHKIGPAIAAGNSIVLKPASTAARVPLLLGEIVLQTRLPKGTVNIVTCSGAEAGQLVTDERLKLLSFTGSPAVGWEMKAHAGKKKVVLELGGNAAVIVDEGVDLEEVIPKIVQGAFGNAGQSCIAVQRILVHTSLMESFSRRLVEAVGKIPCGDPRDEKTLVGPMIDEAAAKRVEGWVQEAVKGGARVLCGGKRKGALLEPIVLTNVNPEMNVCSQEVFAPLAVLVPFSSMTEALEIANNSTYGLQAGVFTKNLPAAFAAYEKLDVGGVILNDVPNFRIDHMPYGGVKDSGFGREGIRNAIEEMTELKLMVLNLS